MILVLYKLPVPEINDDEVLVKMIAASINPGDFLFIQNLYPEPKKLVFPKQIAGNYGAGIIIKVKKIFHINPELLLHSVILIRGPNMPPYQLNGS
ncbi:hypothetical protein [Shimazuella alba]|uniref:Uncharacterized protein n=1 Tax=Shimazuella alba TaxID=2690964 RepID=A0A6I4VZH1_9BACL|nr:hypothetical protein [Shimazuella alba]MXQ53844.1 hypothetical protein [Shimazuella alba]